MSSTDFATGLEELELLVFGLYVVDDDDFKLHASISPNDGLLPTLLQSILGGLFSSTITCGLVVVEGLELESENLAITKTQIKINKTNPKAVISNFCFTGFITVFKFGCSR
jgi:hypothetical protein